MNVWMKNTYFHYLYELLHVFRRWRTSSFRVPVAVWRPTSWESATATTTTSCWRPAVTCSTSTSGSSWDTHRCLETSNGELDQSWQHHSSWIRSRNDGFYSHDGVASSSSNALIVWYSDIEYSYTNNDTVIDVMWVMWRVQGPRPLRLHLRHGVCHQRRRQTVQPLPRLCGSVLRGVQPDQETHTPVPQPAGPGGYNTHSSIHVHTHQYIYTHTHQYI